MSKVEHIMQQVSNRHVSVAEGYEKLMNFPWDEEFESILQILFKRERLPLEEKL